MIKDGLELNRPSWAQVGGPKLGPSGSKLGPTQKFWDPNKSKKYKFSKSKSVLPKMSARSGLVGKMLLAPVHAISGKFLHGPEKCKKHVLLIFYATC